MRLYRPSIVGIMFGAAILSFSGCEWLPRKPEDVFVVYREHMISQKIGEARQFLADDSLQLVAVLETQYKLNQPVEQLALLNVLDPTSPPILTESGETRTVLQIRTLTGGNRHVRMVRKDVEAQWRVDLSEELAALQRYLETKAALDLVREQAIEYASSWKAFSEQLDRMKATQPPPPEEPGPKDISVPAKKNTGRKR